MAIKHHTHAAVLKEYGFKLIDKKTGPNPVHPNQHSTLESTWKHYKFGKLTVNHLKHTFGVYQPYMTLKIGKNNEGLIYFLEKQKSATAPAITGEQKIPNLQTFDFVLQKHGYKPGLEDNTYTKGNALAYINTETQVVVLYANGASEYVTSVQDLEVALVKIKADSKFFKLNPGENKIKFLVPETQFSMGYEVEVKPTEPPPPFGLATKYVHANYGYNYTWQIEDKNYFSSQNKTITADKMQWMVKNNIVTVPLKQKVDELVKAPPSKEELKKLDLILAKAEENAKAWKAKKTKGNLLSADFTSPTGASEAIHTTLIANGYKFIAYGNKTHYPKYKDAEAKTVYVTNPAIDAWEYYPMGSSSMNPYGSSMGQGIEELDKVLKTPFEKPAMEEHYHEASNYSQTTKKLYTPHCPELIDEPFAPVTSHAKELETGETIGGTASGHVDILPGKKFTAVEITAISSYKSSGSSTIQQHALQLAKDDSKLGGHKLTNWVKAIDSAIAKCRINKDVILFRGVSGHYAQLCVDTFIPGATIHPPKAFIGCSSYQTVSHGGFSGQDKLVFRIHCPKGTPAVAVQHITTYYSSEQEILLPRQAELKVNFMFSSGGKIYADCSLQLAEVYLLTLSDVAASEQKGLI